MHGWFCPVAPLVNLMSWLAGLAGFDFLSGIEVIGRPNTGAWYYGGFVVGLLSLGSMGSSDRN